LRAGAGDLVATDIFKLGAGFNAELALRIETEEILVSGLRPGEVAEAALVNFAFGEQRAEAVAAGGILAAEKFILADGVVEGFLILEDAAFFGEEVGDGGNGGVGTGRGGIAMVNGAVGVENAIVLEAGALLLRAAFERFAEAFGAGEGRGAGGRVLRSGGECRQARRGKQGESQDTEARGIGPGGQHRGSDSALHRRPGGRVSASERGSRTFTPQKTLLIIGASR
jgi:hypothetical protein